MAEILGLVAGTFACVTIIGSVAKDVNSLRRTLERIKAAQKEIELFKDEVHDYGNILGLACSAIAPFQHLPIEDYNPVLNFMLENDLWSTLVKTCQTVKDEIREHVLDIRGLRGKSKLIAKFKWMAQRSELEALRPRMEGVKSSLQIVLGSLQLDMLRSLPRTEYAIIEIERLKGQIKKHVKAIRKLEEKLEQSRKFTNSTESALKFASLVETFQSALQDLGKSIVYKGCVPGHPSPKPLAIVSSMSTESEARCSSTDNTSVSTFPTSAKNHSNRSLSLTVGSISNSSTRTKSRTNTVHLPVTIPATLEAEQQVKISKTEVDKLSEKYTPPEEIITVPPPELDVLGVRSTSKLIRLDLDEGYQGETVYIHTPTGRFHISDARLYKDLSVNLISQNFVAEHNFKNTKLFDMNNLAKEDELWVQIGNGIKERCIGRVQLRWNTSAGIGAPDFPVECWICVHGVDVMFGRPFAEKKRQVLLSKRGVRG